MSPISHLVLIFAYVSAQVFGHHLSKLGKKPENECSFYCFLVPEQREKLHQYKELEPYKTLNCSHMVYSFAHIDSKHRTIVGPTWFDTPEIGWEGNYKSVASLHEWKNMTVLLGIFQNGKLPFIGQNFTREKISKEVVKTARTYNFQGLFFYFKDGDHLEDPLFLTFLDTLKAELDNDTNSTTGQERGRLKIVMSVGAKHVETSNKRFKEIDPYFDAFYLLADDTKTAEDPTIAVQVDPLYSTNEKQSIISEDTISFAAEGMVTHGIVRHKIIIGLNVWANSFVFENATDAGHGSKISAKGNNSVTGRKDGKLAYYEICQLRKELDLTYDAVAETTSFFADKLWIAMNAMKHKSFENKLKWVAQNNFGGVGLASLKADDKNDTCGEGVFPVHRYVSDHLSCPWINEESEEAEVVGASDCPRICVIRPDEVLGSAGFSFGNMDPSWCSHIVISSAKILSVPGTIFIPSKVIDAVKEFHKWEVRGKPKLIISIGAYEASEHWRSYLINTYKRQLLIDSIKEIIVTHNADGVDISWTRGHLDSAKDMEVYSIFLEDLNKQLGNSFLIFVEVTPQSTFNDRYDFFRMNQAADYIIAQGHRFHAHNKAFTGHHSPLFMTEDLSDIRMTIEGFSRELIRRGVPKNKLIVGLTAEAMGMRLFVGEKVESHEISIGAASSPFDFVRRNPHPGSVSQTDVCSSLRKNTTIARFNTQIGVPYLIDGPEFIAYDDTHSMQLKTIWASMQNYGGIALFGIEMDNIEGECPHGETYPLLKTIVATHICNTCTANKSSKAETPRKSSNADATRQCQEPTFQVLCDYKLNPENGTDFMEPYMIPDQKCTEVIVEEASLNADGKVEYEKKAAKPLEDLVDFYARHKRKARLVSAVRCNMTGEEFDKTLSGGKSAFFDNLWTHLNNSDFAGVELRCHDLVTPVNKESFGSMLKELENFLKHKKSSKECTKTVGIRIPIQVENLTASYDTSIMNRLHNVVIDPTPSAFNFSELLNPLFDKGTEVQSITLGSTISNWMDGGLSRRKIVFGIPSYGIQQEFVEDSDHGLGKPVNESFVILPRAKICRKFGELGVEDRQFVYEAVGAYAMSSKKEFFAFETPETVKYKVRYAIREKLGGVALNGLNYEDFNNICDHGKFPLLEAIDQNRCV